MWIYHLKLKSEACKTFETFKREFENQTEKKIKCIRSDRGGEFLSNDFIKLCQQEGIKHELTAHSSSQQNGVVERRNRTLVEMARAMVVHKDCPKFLWGEATTTAVYILNRCPTKSVINMTPYEAIWNKKPDISHLRVFGSMVYAHKTQEKKDKLDETSIKCVLIGYSEQSKAYRLMEPVSQKLIISRDVIINEMRKWNWDQNVECQSDIQPPLVEMNLNSDSVHDS